MADSKLRYPTLAALKAAYESGELARSDFLVIDNDCTPVYLRGDFGDFEKVFDGGAPAALLEEALDLLGIPWEDA